MIVFEMALLITAGVVTVVTIAAMGRPLAEAYAEKLKARYKELESDVEANLKSRLGALEEEVSDLKRQVIQIQETSEFTTKLLESQRLRLTEIEEKQEQ